MGNKKAPARPAKARYLVADIDDSNAAVFEADSAEDAARCWFREMTDGGDSPAGVSLECYVVLLSATHHFKASVKIAVERIP